MDRPNLGFAIFLMLLLLAPKIPVGGFDTDTNVSVGAAGFVMWLMLAPRLPLRVVLAMPTVLGLIAFAVYILLVSLASGRLVSVAYAAQYACYAIAAGVLIPAYLVHRTRQGRQAEAWRILAWVGGIYLVGILLSLWTGPIYPHQVGMAVKHYGSVDILRGAGFAESANAAGGIAAVLAAFYLLLYRPARRMSLLLSVLALAGLIATLSRSAMIAFAGALFVLGVLLALRALLVRGTVRLRLPVIPLALLVIGISAAALSFQHPTVSAAWQRLVLDEERLAHDVDKRLDHWLDGAETWADKPVVEQMAGSGFRSGGANEFRGTHRSAHNAYVEMLNDFGLAGLLILLATLIVALCRATYAVLTQPDDRLSMFCLVGLSALMVHNATQVFFYSVVTLTFLIVLLTCGELARQEQRRRRPDRRPGIAQVPLSGRA
jgi:O-antigen ligase